MQLAGLSTVVFVRRTGTPNLLCYCEELLCGKLRCVVLYAAVVRLLPDPSCLSKGYLCVLYLHIAII